MTSFGKEFFHSKPCYQTRPIFQICWIINHFPFFLFRSEISVQCFLFCPDLSFIMTFLFLEVRFYKMLIWKYALWLKLMWWRSEKVTKPGFFSFFWVYLWQIRSIFIISMFINIIFLFISTRRKQVSTRNWLSQVRFLLFYEGFENSFFISIG